MLTDACCLARSAHSSSCALEKASIINLPTIHVYACGRILLNTVADPRLPAAAANAFALARAWLRSVSFMRGVAVAGGSFSSTRWSLWTIGGSFCSSPQAANRSCTRQ